MRRLTDQAVRHLTQIRISFKDLCGMSGISVADQAANKFLREYVDRENSLKDALKALRTVDRDNSSFIDVREV